jgi:tetratricopeptide (TPR) repeat protein
MCHMCGCISGIGISWFNQCVDVILKVIYFIGKGVYMDMFNENEHSLTAIQWFNKGYDYDIKEDYDNAIFAYTKAIELNPHDPDAYTNRGVIYDIEGKYDLAIMDYTKAIELDPLDADVYTNRGVIYDNKGEYDLAIVDYTKAIELNPQDADAFANRGVIYANKGKYDLALTDYTKVIELNPQDADAYFNKATIYKELKYNTEAIEAYSLFLRYAPSADSNVEKAKQQIRELGGTI